MNETSPSLVTTYSFKGGKEYVVRMKIVAFRGCQRSLELTVTDKYTAEDWQSSYDTAYVENLTHKTGNYKHFDVFVAMLQSGLLKVNQDRVVKFYDDRVPLNRNKLQTSECITLDLLTFEDLESLRAHRHKGNSCTSLSNTANNRRYLILTYTVEFDRIHYPLPLEYCGLPDPIILQATIRKFQAEIEKLQNTGVNKHLQRRIEQLTSVNQRLVLENQRLSSGGKGLRGLFESIKILESNVAKERALFKTQIQKLKSENSALMTKIQQLGEYPSRKPGDGSPSSKRRIRPLSTQSRYSNRKSRSRSPSITCQAKTTSLSSGSSVDSFRTRRSPCRNRKTLNDFAKDSKVDLGHLESRIHTLQRMLKEGINLN